MLKIAWTSLIPVWIVWVTCCSLQGTARADSASIPELPRRENFYLFLLAGQSNMAGRGKVSDEDRAPVPRVLMLDKENQWVPAVEPLHYDKTGVGTGLGKSFGVEVAKSNPEITVGLIPCAVGGSPIASWKPGVAYPPRSVKPWDNCMERTRIALKSGTLKAILWHQGESDCKAGLSEVYETELTDLVRRFREELDAPGLPFVIGQLGQFQKPRLPRDEHWQAVDAAHQSLPEKVPQAIFVKSDGLTDKDGIHFDSQSYRELGRRYARAYFELTKPARQR